MTGNVVRAYTFVRFHEYELIGSGVLKATERADESAVGAINRPLRFCCSIISHSFFRVYRCRLARGTDSLLDGTLSASGVASLFTAEEKHVSLVCHMGYY